jgi:methyl-accepting chemotaxis protein
MSDGNPIAAAAQDKVSWAEGSGLVQDAKDLVDQVSSDQWAAGLTTLLSAGLNVRDAIQDPMAKLISMGLGWVIEFFDPLNAWLDWLTCDTEQLTVAAETWSGISAEMRTAADELDGYYKTDTAGWSGPAVDQYRIFCADRVDLYNAAAGAAAATANLVNRNKVLLTMVRSIVRDLITEGVGKVISIVLRYPPPVTVAASGEIVGQVTRTGNAIVDLVRKLQQALKNAMRLLRQSNRLFKEIRESIRDLNALTTVVSRHTKSQARAMDAYNKSMDLILDNAKNLPGAAVRPMAREAVGGLAEKVGMEILKEPTKYGQGRADETAPEHPAVENRKGDGV